MLTSLNFSSSNLIKGSKFNVHKNNNKMQTNNQQQSRVYDEYKKIFCAYHKTQFLTNFCVDKNCLMPLCPSCIVDHTEQHYREPSKPLYMNLHQALYDAKQSCLNNIQEFETCAIKLRQMSEFKKKLIQEVHNQLVQHKQNIYTLIQRMFMNFEHQVYNMVVADYEQQGLYREDDINQYQLRVQDTINQLYDKIGNIKGDQCLAALIMFYGEQRQRISDIKNQCQSFIFKHDSSRIDTLLDEAAMKDQLSNLFENLIEIKRISNSPSNQKRYEQLIQLFRPIQRRTPQKINLNNSRLSQSRKSRIFNRSDSKFVSPPKQNLSISNKKERGIKYQSAYR